MLGLITETKEEHMFVVYDQLTYPPYTPNNHFVGGVSYCHACMHACAIECAYAYGT